jgi:hypothetical protein
MHTPIARQRLGKHIPATHAHATMAHPLLSNGAVNTPPQQYRLFSVGSVMRGYKGTKKVA